MTTHSSSTTGDSSEVAMRVVEALEGATSGRSRRDLEKVAEVLDRIRDLESRGFIRRQKFVAPTTLEFERKSHQAPETQSK